MSAAEDREERNALLAEHDVLSASLDARVKLLDERLKLAMKTDFLPVEMVPYISKLSGLIAIVRHTIDRLGRIYIRTPTHELRRAIQEARECEAKIEEGERDMMDIGQKLDSRTTAAAAAARPRVKAEAPAAAAAATTPAKRAGDEGITNLLAVRRKEGPPRPLTVQQVAAKVAYDLAHPGAAAAAGAAAKPAPPKPRPAPAAASAAAASAPMDLHDTATRDEAALMDRARNGESLLSLLYPAKFAPAAAEAPPAPNEKRPCKVCEAARGWAPGLGPDERGVTPQGQVLCLVHYAEAFRCSECKKDFHPEVVPLRGKTVRMCDSCATKTAPPVVDLARNEDARVRRGERPFEELACTVCKEPMEEGQAAYEDRDGHPSIHAVGDCLQRACTCDKCGKQYQKPLMAGEHDNGKAFRICTHCYADVTARFHEAQAQVRAGTFDRFQLHKLPYRHVLPHNSHIPDQEETFEHIRPVEVGTDQCTVCEEELVKGVAVHHDYAVSEDHCVHAGKCMTTACHCSRCRFDFAFPLARGLQRSDDGTWEPARFCTGCLRVLVATNPVDFKCDPADLEDAEEDKRLESRAARDRTAFAWNAGLKQEEPVDADMDSLPGLETADGRRVVALPVPVVAPDSAMFDDEEDVPIVSSSAAAAAAARDPAWSLAAPGRALAPKAAAAPRKNAPVDGLSVSEAERRAHWNDYVTKQHPEVGRAQVGHLKLLIRNFTNARTGNARKERVYKDYKEKYLKKPATIAQLVDFLVEHGIPLRNDLPPLERSSAEKDTGAAAPAPAPAPVRAPVPAAAAAAAGDAWDAFVHKHGAALTDTVMRKIIKDNPRFPFKKGNRLYLAYKAAPRGTVGELVAFARNQGLPVPAALPAAAEPKAPVPVASALAQYNQASAAAAAAAAAPAPAPAPAPTLKPLAARSPAGWDTDKDEQDPPEEEDTEVDEEHACFMCKDDDKENPTIPRRDRDKYWDGAGGGFLCRNHFEDICSCRNCDFVGRKPCWPTGMGERRCRRCYYDTDLQDREEWDSDPEQTRERSKEEVCMGCNATIDQEDVGELYDLAPKSDPLCSNCYDEARTCSTCPNQDPFPYPTRHPDVFTSRECPVCFKKRTGRPPVPTPSPVAVRLPAVPPAAAAAPAPPKPKPKRDVHRWTADEDIKVLMGHANGKSWEEIGVDLGLSAKKVQGRYKQLVSKQK